VDVNIKDIGRDFGEDTKDRGNGNTPVAFLS
jgi:hypothetical protein